MSSGYSRLAQESQNGFVEDCVQAMQGMVPCLPERILKNSVE